MYPCCLNTKLKTPNPSAVIKLEYKKIGPFDFCILLRIARYLGLNTVNPSLVKYSSDLLWSNSTVFSKSFL